MQLSWQASSEASKHDNREGCRYVEGAGRKKAGQYQQVLLILNNGLIRSQRTSAAFCRVESHIHRLHARPEKTLCKKWTVRIQTVNFITFLHSLLFLSGKAQMQKIGQMQNKCYKFTFL